MVLVMTEEKESPEVLLGRNSDGLQCADKLTKCKDSVCYLNLDDGDTIRYSTVGKRWKYKLGPLPSLAS